MAKRLFLKYKLFSKIISVVLALVFLIVGGLIARPLLAKYALSQADYYFNGGAYDLFAAVKWYQAADFLGSESSFIHYQLARIYFVENKLEEAKEEIDIALVQDPANQRSFYIRGLIDGFAKNYSEAISDFEKFTVWSPREWAGWNDLAWVSYEAEDYVKAKNAALTGLKIDAANPWLLNNLGLAYLGLGEKDEAQTIFIKAKNNAESLTLEKWSRAYPGNNPGSAEWNLAKFKTNVTYNATLASGVYGEITQAEASSKGRAVSACVSSSYNTCSGSTCQANPCTICDSPFDGNCCSWYSSTCSSDADCCSTDCNDSGNYCSGASYTGNCGQTCWGTKDCGGGGGGGSCSIGASPTCGSYSDQQTVNVYSFASGRTGEWWCDNHFGVNLGGNWDCISVSGGSCGCDAPLGSNVTCGRCATGGGAPPPPPPPPPSGDCGTSGCGGCVAGGNCTAACQSSGFGNVGLCVHPGSTDPGVCCWCTTSCPPYCGDGICTEGCNNCLADCGVCPPPPPTSTPTPTPTPSVPPGGKTLSVALTVSPGSGNAPLSTTLTATVSGTAVGTMNYTFWWNCNNPTVSVAAATAVCGDPTNAANGAKFDNVNDNPKAVNHTYSSVGTFYPKVIVERDTAAPATEVKTVAVGAVGPNNPPTVGPGGGGSGGGGSPLVSQPNYCVSGPAATVDWSFIDPDAGDFQSAYQVQIDTNSNFSSPEVDSTKTLSASNSYATAVGALVYNGTYYWRVRVWDNHNAVSLWASGAPFSTPEHAYPTVSFSSSLASPSVYELVSFTDLSSSGSAIVQWTWTIPDAAYEAGFSAASQNPKVKFTSPGTKSVVLKIKDADGYECSNSISVEVRLALPWWREE